MGIRGRFRPKRASGLQQILQNRGQIEKNMSGEPSGDKPSDDKKTRNQYRAYMLRCWTEEYEGQVVWRYSLEAVSDRQRTGFADLSSLFHFLQTAMATAPASLETAIRTQLLHAEDQDSEG